MNRSVVIPSFKAEDTLPGVIESLPAEILESGAVLIVNDASPDGTGRVADELAAEHPNVHAVHHGHNRGYGGALKTGMRAGIDRGFDLFAIVHADGQYAPEMVLQLCEPIEKGNTEIVQGSRIKGGARNGESPMPMSRYLPNRVLSFLENLTFGTAMTEFHSGYMIYSAELLRRVPFEKLQENFNFDAEMIIMAHLCGIRCAEIPIPTRYDDDASSLNPVPYGLNVLKMMWKFTSGHYRELLDQHEAAHPPAGRTS